MPSLLSSTHFDLRGKILVFEVYEKETNIFLPSSDWKTIPDHAFSEYTVTLYVDELRKGREKKRTELGHIDYQVYRSARPWLKDELGIVMSSVYVDEEYRKRQLGSFMMDFTLNYIDIYHGYSVSLFVDNYYGDITREKLYEWYGRFGFKKVVGEDEPGSTKRYKKLNKRGYYYVFRDSLNGENDDVAVMNRVRRYINMFNCKETLAKKYFKRPKRKEEYSCTWEEFEGYWEERASQLKSGARPRERVFTGTKRKLSFEEVGEGRGSSEKKVK